MSLLVPIASPFDLVHVALDLETTGLDSSRDTIIEVGAVKFQGDREIDSFQTFVNPGRSIPDHIQRLTHITPQQVQRAPMFGTIADDLAAFIGDHPVIGHNISFDVGFLASHGLPLDNSAYDTWDLASVFLPRSMQYSLSQLTSFLGVDHGDPHRALSDAKATRGVFLQLLRRAAALDSGLIGYISGLAVRSRWVIAPLLQGLEAVADVGVASSGLTGLDMENLSSRLARPEQRRPDHTLRSLSQQNVAQFLGLKGYFSQTFSGFEHRPEQEEMLAAVTDAIYGGHHLVVEGGTGVGKSMAYLLPAVLFALSKGRRVVISTNTINLQEQLMRKDIPALVEVLEHSGVVPKGVVQAALLKGRANYLCLHRWNHLARSEAPSVDEARLLGKTAVWMQDTISGDRGEINLSGRDAYTWSRVSAGEKGWCPGLRDGGPCFLRSARERAEQAHIVVVNHALLMSDLMRGGSLIPDYQYLIVDEAHNLESEATSQLGFHVPSDRLDEAVETQSRITTEVRLAIRSAGLAAGVGQDGERALADVEAYPARLRTLWARVWAAAEKFLNAQRKGDTGDTPQILLTDEVRSQGDWDELALAWENLDVGLQQATNALSRLQRFLDTTSLPGASDQPTIIMEVATIHDNLELLRGQLHSVLGSADPGDILWVARDAFKGEIGFHSAPLDVGATLSEQLFDRKECVVLTSATLSTDGNFEYLRKRSGLPEDSEELLVGSPFDYQKAALLLIPEDMPAPSSQGYVEALSRVLVDLAKSLGGHTLALFTAYSSLRAVSQRARAPLQAEGIDVLAQSIDGSPQQLMNRFAENPKSLLLGTSSFWEGVDLPGGVLKAVVLTRLPFQVPTDPIVRARSEQFEDPFKEYSVPQAVLRFRQGIGRLIRSKEDKGAIVVLDSRITGRSYGQSFLHSMPPCTLQPSSLSTVGSLAARWMGGSRATRN